MQAENLMLEKGDNKEVLWKVQLIESCELFLSVNLLMISKFPFVLQYLPIEGLVAFNKVTAELLLGADNVAIQQGRVCNTYFGYCSININTRKMSFRSIWLWVWYAFVVQVATVQSLSGTGSLRLAAAFIQRYFPDAKVLISSPTWGKHIHFSNFYWLNYDSATSSECIWPKLLILWTGNHKNIFNDARVPWSEYRYYDPRTVGLDFDGMIADIKVWILIFLSFISLIVNISSCLWSMDTI